MLISVCVLLKPFYKVGNIVMLLIFLVLRSRLNIENYSSVSVEGILQDLHAKLLTKNLAASTIHDVKRKIKKPRKNRRYDYKVNTNGNKLAIKYQ